MARRIQIAVSILLIAAALSALILLADFGPLLRSKAQFFLSLVQPLVDAFGSHGAIATLMGGAVTTSALVVFWPAQGERVRNKAPSQSSGKIAAVPEYTPRRRDILASTPSTLEEPVRQAPSHSEPAALPEPLSQFLPAQQKCDGPRPAWGLMLASPWGTDKGFTSWLGGIPCAPAGFEWPRDPRDGVPMPFFGQIDLAALKPESTTGQRAPGLPEAGAMLVFIGFDCAVRIVGAEEMIDAQPVIPPADMPDLRELGYWCDGSTFPAWPVIPQAFLEQPYLEENEDGDWRIPPAAFPNRHSKPADWITNWGMAALDVQLALTAVGNDMRNMKGNIPGASYAALLQAEGPALVAELEQWLARAESHDPMQPVDSVALARLFEKRLAFCEKVAANFGGTISLRGAYYEVWEKIWSANRGPDPFIQSQTIPKAYRRFVEERITGWRQHRLFGYEPPFPNNPEDLTGKACLISIDADSLMKMQTEHDYGISLWAPEEDLRNGRYDRLEVIRHCAV